MVTTHQRSQQFLVQYEEDFYVQVITKLQYARSRCNLENPLYSVLHYICETVRTNIKAADPETLFFTNRKWVFEPKVVLKRPVIGTSIGDSQTQSEDLDFYRFFTTRQGEGLWDETPDIRRLVDVWVIKPFTEDINWQSEEGREEAGKLIEKHLFEVYSQAMEGFVRHPEWKVAYAMLVVGIYFSQFCWERPEGDIRPPVDYEYDKAILDQPLSLEEHQDAVDKIRAAISECGARDLPEILAWNEPMFVGNISRCTPKIDLKLSPSMLWSMAQPLKNHPGVKIEPGCFDAPEEQPECMIESIVSVPPTLLPMHPRTVLTTTIHAGDAQCNGHSRGSSATRPIDETAGTVVVPHYAVALDP